MYVDTTNSWPRDEFIDYLEKARIAAGFSSTYAMATAAGLSHTTISVWYGSDRKPGKQPSPLSLSALAKVLRVSTLELWRAAGLLTEHDEDEVAADILNGLRLIEESGLTARSRALLREIFLKQQHAFRENLRTQVDAFRQAESANA